VAVRPTADTIVSLSVALAEGPGSFEHTSPPTQLEEWFAGSGARLGG